MKWIFNMPVLGFFDPLWRGIKISILQLVWTILVRGPLEIINIFSKILNYLSGGMISDILFGSDNKFDYANIPGAFWIIILIVASSWVLILGIQFIILMCRETAEIKVKFFKAFTSSIKGIIFIVVIPFIFFIANLFVSKLSETITASMGAENSIAGALYRVGSPNQSINVPEDFSSPSNILDYNIFIEIVTVWFMLYVILMTGMILVQKVVELMFLFIVAPVFGMLTVLDEGARLKKWGEFSIGKFLATLSTLIGWYTFVGIMQKLSQVIYSGQTSLGSNWMAQGVVLFLVIAGGGLALINFSTLVAAFIGESTGMHESMAGMRSLVAGIGLGGGAMKMGMKGLGFISKNKTAGASKLARGYSGTSGYDMNALNSSQAVSNPMANQPNYMMNSLMTQQSAGQGGFSNKVAQGKYGNLAKKGGVVGLVGLGLTGATVGATRAIANWKNGGFKGFARGVGRGMTAPFIAIGRGISGWSPQLVSTARIASKTSAINHNDLMSIKSTKLKNKKNELVSKTDSITNANSKVFHQANKKINKIDKKIFRHDKYTNKRNEISQNRENVKNEKNDKKLNK